MAATVTLVYDCAVGIQDPANFVAAVAAVAIADELPAFAMTVNADNTAVAGSLVRRTIVLNCSANTNAWLPSNALIKDATRKWFAMKIGQQVPCSVVAAEPVVA